MMSSKSQAYDSEKRLWLYSILKASPDSEGVLHRTRIQKLVFLLQDEFQDGEIAPPEFEFKPGEYGPYSSELASALDRLTQHEFIQEREERQPDGTVFYQYDIAPEIENVVAQDLDKNKRLEQTAREIFAKYSDSDLPELVYSVMGKYPELVV
jgi:uncharacterized protein YwgA